MKTSETKRVCGQFVSGPLGRGIRKLEVPRSVASRACSRRDLVDHRLDLELLRREQ